MAEDKEDYGAEDSFSPDRHEEGGPDGLIASDLALPDVMLRALFRKQPGGLAGAARRCVILGVPTEDWVKPVARAAAKLSGWSDVVSVTKFNPKEPQEYALRILAGGKGVLCISQAPERHLPGPLQAAADLRLDMPSPDAAVLRKVIRMATGRRCRHIPEGVAGGLDFSTLSAAIRKGSSPGLCVARLVAAARAGSLQDPGLASVPDLSELAGYGEAMTWCTRLVEDIDRWRKGLIGIADIQRTAVFASDPGLGKSTLVRSLAKSAGLPLFATSVGTWFSQSAGYLDSVIKEIDRVFTEASKVAPAIIFLDEIEGIPSRSSLDGRSSSWWMPVVGHLLTTLDGAASGVASRLIVIGATNYPERLDTALTRPGRLHPVIRIERPDKANLAKIFRQHLGDFLPGADLEGLASVAVGASGADVVAWVKGARATARALGRPLKIDDLRDQVAPDAPLDQGLRYRVAVHEAGHAVLAEVLDVGRVHSVALTSGRGSGGVTSVDMDGLVLTKATSDALVTFLLAGMCAEASFIGDASSGSGGDASSDLSRATQIIAANHASLGIGLGLAFRAPPEEALGIMNRDPRLLAHVEDDLQRLRAESAALIETNRQAIAELAEAIVRERVVPGEMVRLIISRHSVGGPRHG